MPHSAQRLLGSHGSLGMALPPGGASGERVTRGRLAGYLGSRCPQEGVCRWGLIVPNPQNPALLTSLTGCSCPASADQAPPGAEDPDIQGSPACPPRGSWEPGPDGAGEMCAVEANKGRGLNFGGGGSGGGCGWDSQALPAGGPCSHRGTRDLDLSLSGDGQTPCCPPLGVGVGCKHSGLRL